MITNIVAIVTHFVFLVKFISISFLLKYLFSPLLNKTANHRIELTKARKQRKCVAFVIIDKQNGP